MDDQELQTVLRRAQEIDSRQGLLLRTQEDVDSFVSAAEETGISREAVLQALQERMRLPMEEYEPGSFVFAKAADGKFHVATLLRSDSGSARVRFLSGAEHSCGVYDLRVFSLTPGQRVEFFSPSMSMWSSGAVNGSNMDARTITVSHWGTEETISFEKIRIRDEQPTVSNLDQGKAWMIGIVSGLVGTGLGALLMTLLSR